MESLMRPFHRRKESFSKKHSNVSSFSEKKAYDDVFSAAAKFGAPAYSSRIEDYKEIFGGSRASSIPILDLPALDEAKATVDARSSNLDYLKIFGGLRDEDVAVPYEEVLAKSKGAKSSSGKARTPAKTSSSSDGSASSSCYEGEVCQRGAPNQSFEGMKQCNAFYNKTTLGSNDGTNRTIHVAQLRAVPGFTCFIDENLQKRGDKLGPPPQDEVQSFPKVDAELNKKRTPDRTEKSKSQSSWDKFYSIDRTFDANGSSFRTHSFKFSSPTRVHASIASNRSSTSDAYKAGPGDCSPSFSDEDIDVDSAAAASAAALRKAVEEAQACIRLAKEMMERNKNAPKRFPKPYSKDGLEVKKKREDSIPNLREKNTAEVCKTVDFVVQVITKSEREKARSKKVAPNLKESEEVFIANKGAGETNGNYFKPCGDCEAQISKPERETAQRSGKVAPKFTQSEESFIAKHVVGETKGGKSEPSEDCKALKKLPEVVNTGEWRTATLESERIADSNIFQSVHAYKSGKKEMQTEEEILEQLDGHGKEVFEETKELNDSEGTPNIVKMAQDGVQCVHDIAQEVHEQEGKEKTAAVQENEDTEEQKTSSAEEKYEKELVDSVEQSEIADSEFQDVNANNDGELGEAQECLENEKIQQESLIEKEHKFSKGVHEEEESVKHICEHEEIENGLQEACEWRDYEVAFEVKSNESRQNDDEGEERNDKRLDKIHGLDIDKDKQDGFSNLEESDKRREANCDWKGKEEILIEACQYEETEGIKQETGGNVRTDVFVEASESLMNLDGNDTLEEEASDHLSDCEVAPDNTINFEENERISKASQSSCDFNVDELGFEEVENLNDVNFEEENMEMSDVLQSREFNEDMNTEVPYTEGEREMFMTGPLVEDAAEHVMLGHMVTDATRSLLFINPTTYVALSDSNFDAKQTELNEDESELAYDTRADSKASVSESGEDKRKPKEERTAFNREEIKPDPSTASVERIWVELGNRMEASQLPNVFEGEEEKTRGTDEGQRVEMEIRMEASQPCNVFEGEEKLRGIDEEIKTSQNVQNDDANKTSEVEEESTKGTAQKEVESESKQLKGNDETSKREREREKDRMVVERAIREARERAFAEARERAERVAVERATAEARQRVMAEARQKFEKANVATKSSAEKASLQAKLRSERAAVERATAEARERALEKALSQKKLDGNDGESAQRCKARLERHHRTMERAAKALAEKNMRDLLAQKEQAERHRLAETLDAEVKRWSSGKEGNLRALLSTLQYILGPDSGWHPISLTEIVTTTAVKKAYRKATLHVHPDKLQQRGASIQQKYICEKIFDLLKAAWNRFDSEER